MFDVLMSGLCKGRLEIKTPQLTCKGHLKTKNPRLSMENQQTIDT
jgi:hypothetical protein